MSDQARKLWQEKLELLLAEEVTAVDPAAKFKIRQDIAEARAKLDELAPDPRPAPEPDQPIKPKWTDDLRIYGARRLIEKHEYHRRDGELADAEAVGW